MQDEELIKLAQELTETVRKNRTVDWDKKEFARAYKRERFIFGKLWLSRVRYLWTMENNRRHSQEASQSKGFKKS